MKRVIFTLLITCIAVFQTGCEEIASIVESSSGCMLPDAPNYNETALLACTTNCIGEQSGANCCCEEIIYGCMDESAPNYSATANAACIEIVSGVETQNACCTESITGCMDQGASNYDPLATVADNSTCTYDQADVTLEDGTTVTVVYGCMNSDACNFVITANADCNQENSTISGSEWVQNDDCCDLSANSVCYLDLNNNGYWEESDSTSANLPTCNCGELGVGWVTKDDVAANQEVQGCTQPVNTGFSTIVAIGTPCSEFNPSANVDNGGCCLTELTEEELANPEFNLVGIYNLEYSMGMLDENGDCIADAMMNNDEYGPEIDQVVLGPGGGFSHHVEHVESFDSRPEWEYRVPGVNTIDGCEDAADTNNADYWFCGNWGVGDIDACEDFWDQQGCMSSPGCSWETNFCHPTFFGMPCHDINFAPEFADDPQYECEMRDDCEWDFNLDQCFTPVWEPWMECIHLEEYECEADWNDDGIDHCEIAEFDPSELDCLSDCNACDLEFSNPDEGPSEDEMCTFAECMDTNDDCWSDCDYDLQDEFEMFGWLSYMCEAPDECGEIFMDDEYNCSDDEFDCDDGSCISYEFECDGKNDCPDGSDEEDCGLIDCMEDCEDLEEIVEGSFEDLCEWLETTAQNCTDDCVGEDLDELTCINYMCDGCTEAFDCSDFDSFDNNEKEKKDKLFHFIRKIIEIPNQNNQLARGNSSGECGDEEIEDCKGDCAPSGWVGDDYCDDGAYEYNGNYIDFNCSDFEYDGGDCEDENDDWDEEDIACIPNLDTYPCFDYDETECMSPDCTWHDGGIEDPEGFCAPPIGNNIGTCQVITTQSECDQKEECHWMHEGPMGEPEGCAPAPPDNCFEYNNMMDCEDSPSCEWEMPDWVDPWADGACFRYDPCRDNPQLNNDEDACNANPMCEWAWEGEDTGCWEKQNENMFCECMLPFDKISCENAGGSWELPPWVMEGDEWAEHECMIPMSQQDCFHEFEDEDPCAEDFSGGNEQTTWDVATHTCTKSFGFSEAGIWSIDVDGNFCIEWENETDDDPDCNTLMTPDECHCFECSWNGATGTCDEWENDGGGRISNYQVNQNYENAVELLSNNNDGECFEYELISGNIHIYIETDEDYGYCEEIILKPAASGT